MLTPRAAGTLAEGGDPLVVRPLATQYSRGLWLHLDAENSVLLPEAEFRLVRDGVHELPELPPSDEQLAAREQATVLSARYPPMADPAIIRGEGCVSPAFGREGLERVVDRVGVGRAAPSRRLSHFPITPQPIRAPELPAGSLFSSSAVVTSAVPSAAGARCPPPTS